MSLYLCIFDRDEEVDGVEVGAYADFGFLRDQILKHLEHGVRGSRFPVLMLHSDCDGAWSPAEAARLQEELEVIAGELPNRPPVPLPSEWQRVVAQTIGLKPRNLDECFFDVDGEPLLKRLQDLCRVSVERALPILFE